MLYAAEVLARSAVKLLEQPERIAKAKEELRERTRDQKYECLIPDDVKPHVL